MKKMTPVMLQHYFRLFYRSLLFLCMLFGFIAVHVFYPERTVISIFDDRPLIVSLIWIVFTLEMLQRFFPSPTESPGCQKQFSKYYIKSGNTQIRIQDNSATMLVALLWILFNAFFGALYMNGLLDDDFMLLLCCAYSVCDMICILFFCPFQTWFFKNKCCVACRIYNWDYAMMFTPLFFVRRIYSYTLLTLALGLLLRWEITFYLHPERFSPDTNDYLQCSRCTEKLCRHKKQFHSLWQAIDAYTRARIDRLRKSK